MTPIKEKIILASAKLFVAHGLKSVTMDDVASSIAISKRTIYENFKDKYDLISSTVDFFIDQQVEKEIEAEKNSDNVIEELLKMFDMIDENFAKRGRLPIEVKKYYPDIFEQKYLQRYEQSFESLCNRLKRGAEQGIIMPDINIKFTAYVIMDSVNNVMTDQEKLFQASRISAPDAFKYVIIHLFRGIATKKGIDLIDTKLKSNDENI